MLLLDEVEMEGRMEGTCNDEESLIYIDREIERVSLPRWSCAVLKVLLHNVGAFDETESVFGDQCVREVESID